VWGHAPPHFLRLSLNLISRPRRHPLPAHAFICINTCSYAPHFLYLVRRGAQIQDLQPGLRSGFASASTLLQISTGRLVSQSRQESFSYLEIRPFYCTPPKCFCSVFRHEKEQIGNFL
jgi:hypothetical protein